MTPTEEALIAMLRESTGTHFLDSGGETGRNWQRNQARDLDAEEPAVLRFNSASVDFTLRTYHWLRDRLEIDAEANEAFDGPFQTDMCRDGTEPSWYELREAFPVWWARWRSRRDGEAPCDCCDDDTMCPRCSGSGSCAGDDDYYAATGIYGDGQPVTVNTYNEESALDQVLLFTYFELRTGPGRGGCSDVYVVLQVHGGCDVRGGYTRPRVFRVTTDEATEIFDFRRGTIFCLGGDESHWWTTDDAGAHWHFEGACGRGAGTQLERYECKNLSPRDEWTAGFLYVNDEGEGLCPLCGSKLVGAP